MIEISLNRYEERPRSLDSDDGVGFLGSLRNRTNRPRPLALCAISHVLPESQVLRPSGQSCPRPKTHGYPEYQIVACTPS